MLVATVFGTTTLVDARFVRFEPDVVLATRDDIHLPGELRYPEAMDHVCRLEFHAKLLTRGNVNLVGLDDARLVVLDLPPPLMTGDGQVCLGLLSSTGG